MTNYDKIRNMKPIDLAIYLVEMREKAIDDYEENGRYPDGIVETLHMLNEEITENNEEMERLWQTKDLRN